VRPWLKRALLGLGGLLGVVAGVCVVRAVTWAGEEPLLPSSPPIPSVDIDGAAGRLAGALAIATVSVEDRTKVDHAAFVRLHDYFERAYPRAHGAMTREVI